MNDTGIRWTDWTWNPWSGCVKVSPGCFHCYAHESAENKRGTKSFPNGFDLTVREHKFNEPLKLKEPSLIFVNSTSDFFLESVSDELRDRILDIMERTPQHQYQVLTKRPHEMLRYSNRRKLPPNFWAGVSVESQDYISRIDLLREVDVEIRFVSAEPLLSPLDLNLEEIHWVIAGGETGQHLLNPRTRAKRALADYDPKTKKWNPRQDRYHWITEIRDQCIDAGVPFFFKQWGGFQPKSAGNLLDGRTWEEYPRLPGYSGVGKFTRDPMPLEEAQPTEVVDGELLGSSIMEQQQKLLAALTEDIKTRIRRSAQDLYFIGLSLLRAQELLPHGEFLPWIRVEFDMSQRSAYKLIAVAKAFRGKFAQDANLEISASALYLLACTDTPQEAREEALELAEAGENITPTKARKIIEKHTSVEQQMAARGESLGLPSRGDSTLPEADHIDKLKHTSPVDVDDRPGASPWGVGAAAAEATFPSESAPEEIPSKNRKPHEPFTSNNSDEHYTPKEIVDAVLECFGGKIDLDPCSNSRESPNVPAINHFTKTDDGLKQDWRSQAVYVNPPYSQVRLWVQKGIQEYLDGRADEIILLVKADTTTKWFKLIWDLAPVVCFVDHRLCFLNESNNGNGATFPSAVAYVGSNLERFYHTFEGKVGVVVTRFGK